MNYGSIKRIELGEEVWLEAEAQSKLAGLLSGTDLLIVLCQGKPPYQVTLGVPHHAASGQTKICERRLDRDGKPAPREADENAASIAIVAFDTLKDIDISCKLVIMAHATTHDPNKEPGSPYCEEIFAHPTRMLFECHGSSSRRNLPLELSAGNNRLADPLRFGRALAAAFGYRYKIGIQNGHKEKAALILHSGGVEEPGELELPARYTHSLVEAGKRDIPALHLEAKPIFRKSRNGGGLPTPDGLVLGQAIADAIASAMA
jgi:hypothetical protein